MDSICGSCSRRGHLSRVCKDSQSQRPPHTQTYSHQSFGKFQSSHKNKKKFHKKGKQRNKVPNMTVSGESSEENVDDLSDVLTHLFSMPEQKDGKSEVIWINVLINGVCVKMELDTVSSIQC